MIMGDNLSYLPLKDCQTEKKTAYYPISVDNRKT